MKSKVSIVEDDPEIRNSLIVLVNSFVDFEFCKDYPDGESCIEDFDNHPADIVIMDINLPGISGIECVRKLKSKYTDTQFMMCTVFEEDNKLFESLEAGATGYLLKSSNAEKLKTALIEIQEGGSPMSPKIARKLVERFTISIQPSEDFENLSQREKEILELLSAGLRYKEIADRLFVSTETIRKHARNIYQKLQVNSRIDALNKVYGKNNR